MKIMNNINLSQETLSEMDMDSIVGGMTHMEASNNCYGGDCAAGCSTGETTIKQSEPK